MTLSTLYIPVLMLKPKFALLFTLGSLFFIISFCFLVGFQTFFKQMFSKPRLVTSISYSACLIIEEPRAVCFEPRRGERGLQGDTFR